MREELSVCEAPIMKIIWESNPDISVPELVKQLNEQYGKEYARTTVVTFLTANIVRAKKAIKNAFECQLAGKGFSLVEVLSNCPTNWGMSPVESMEWLEKNMIPYYPLGVKKDITKEV